jgi:hypothetical protein
VSDTPLPPALLARWEALPAGPCDTRLLCVGVRRSRVAGPYIRMVSPRMLAEYARMAAVEHRNDGTDLAGITSLYWNLVAS